MNYQINFMLEIINNYYTSEIFKKKKSDYIAKEMEKPDVKLINRILFITCIFGILVFLFLLITKLLSTFKYHELRNDMLGASLGAIITSVTLYCYQKISISSNYHKILNDKEDLTQLKQIFAKHQSITINNEQILFLKSLVDEELKAKKTNRNILIGVILLIINFLLSLVIRASFIQYNASPIFFSILVLTAYTLLIYRLADNNARFINFDFFLVKNGLNLMRLKDLLNYMIYHNK